MRVVFGAVALVCMAVGVLLIRHAVRRYGTEKAPRGVSSNPKRCRLVYLVREEFTEPKGFWFHIAGLRYCVQGPCFS